MMKHATSQTKDFATNEMVLQFEIRLSFDDILDDDIESRESVLNGIARMKRWWMEQKPKDAPGGQTAG